MSLSVICLCLELVVLAAIPLICLERPPIMTGVFLLDLAELDFCPAMKLVGLVGTLVLVSEAAGAEPIAVWPILLACRALLVPKTCWFCSILPLIF